MSCKNAILWSLSIKQHLALCYFLLWPRSCHTNCATATDLHQRELSLANRLCILLSPWSLFNLLHLRRQGNCNELFLQLNPSCYHLKALKSPSSRRNPSFRMQASVPEAPNNSLKVFVRNKNWWWLFVLLIVWLTSYANNHNGGIHLAHNISLFLNVTSLQPPNSEFQSKWDSP